MNLETDESVRYEERRSEFVIFRCGGPEGEEFRFVVGHMETLAAICRQDPTLLLETPHRIVDLADAASENDTTKWWSGLTERGGEGMVVCGKHCDGNALLLCGRKDHCAAY